MRISLTSLFLITAMVAACIWGVQQYRYIASIDTRFSVIIPTADRNEIVVRTISPDNTIIVLGSRVKAHIRLVKEDTKGKVEILAEEQLSPGCHTVRLSTTTAPGHAGFGFMLEDRSHFLNVERSTGGHLERGTFEATYPVKLAQVGQQGTNMRYKVVIDPIQSGSSN